MADLASLALAIDSRPAVDAANALDRMGEAASRGEGKVSRIKTATDALVQALQRNTAATNANTAALAQTEAAAGKLAPAMQRAETATDGLASSLNKTAPSAAAVGRALNDNSAAAGILAQRADALRAQVDPLVASQQRLGRTTAEADALFKAGALTQAEHASVVKKATEAHIDLETRVARSSKAAGLSANDWRMLSFQANDAATMILSGSSAFQVLATQGGQVLQILQGANGGIRGALAGVATVGGMATVGIGAGTAALLAGAAAYDSFDTRRQSVARSLLGSGRGSGLSQGDIIDLSRQSQLGGGLAEQLASDFARTGNASGASVAKGLSVTRDLAASLGTDFATAGKALVGVFENPSKALDGLNERFKFLSVGQRSYIKELQAQGRESDAAAFGLDALSRGLGRYNETVSLSTRLSNNFRSNWDDFTTSVSDKAGSLLGDPRADTLGSLSTASRELQTELTTMQKRLAIFEDARKNAFGGGVSETVLDALYPVAGIRRRIDEIIAAQEDLNRRTAVQTQARITAQSIAARVEEQAQQDRITSVSSRIQRDNIDARMSPVERRVADAQREAGVYSGPRDMAAGLAAEAVRLDKAGPTLTDTDRRGSSSLDPIVRPSNLPPIVPSMTASRFSDVFEANGKSAADELKTQVEEGVRINQGKQLEQIRKASATAAEAEEQALGKSIGKQEALRQSAGLRVSLSSEGRKIDEDTAREIERQAEAMGRVVQRMAERRLMSDLEFQRAQLGRTPQEATVAASLRGVYGDDTTSPGYQMAADYQRATLAIGETQRAMASLGQMGSGLIDPLLDSTRSWGDAFGDLSKQIARAALQATIFGQGPFAGAFGTSGAGGGLGGLAGSILGGAGGSGGGGIGGLFSSILGIGSAAAGASGFEGLPMTGGEWFATGGIMTSRGRIPLNAYAGGGVANSPQLAIFGEGRMPEAYVPLPDGRRIPVAMQGGGAAGGNAMPPIQINDNRTVQAIPAQGVTPEQLAAVLEQSNRQFARQIPGIVAEHQRRVVR